MTNVSVEDFCNLIRYKNIYIYANDKKYVCYEKTTFSEAFWGERGERKLKLKGVKVLTQGEIDSVMNKTIKEIAVDLHGVIYVYTKTSMRNTFTEKNENMKCCFCGGALNNIGNSPFPFLKEENPTGLEHGCCDSCNKKYVIPARALVKYNISKADWDKMYCDIKRAIHGEELSLCAVASYKDFAKNT